MKEIPNNQGYYVNEMGEVFSSYVNVGGKWISSPTVRRKRRQQHKDSGYYTVKLRGGKQHRAHRLVAEAYIPNPLNLPQVNHINRVRNDNRVENLEWVTNQRNSEHATAKYYIVEHIASGETFEVYNLNMWCKERGMYSTHLHKTMGPNKCRKQHQGFRLIQLDTRKRTHGRAGGGLR